MTNNEVMAAAEQARRAVDVATWVAIGLGLAFTAVNVQQFAAAGAATWSPGWSVAWLLDPMVSVLLLAVVRAEQVTARWQVPMPWQVTAVKWAAFAATYCMNTWAPWSHLVPSGVVLHSVPPVFVLLAAEVAPALRDRLTQAVHMAGAAACEHELGPTGPSSLLPSAGAESDVDTTAEVAIPVVEARAVGQGAVDPRVQEIAELLAAGCDVTGTQAAAIHEVSDRTGRRLLADARAYLEQHPITTTPPGLHLVEPEAAGSTA